jgi:hypothetical protein
MKFCLCILTEKMVGKPVEQGTHYIPTFQPFLKQKHWQDLTKVVPDKPQAT